MVQLRFAHLSRSVVVICDMITDWLPLFSKTEENSTSEDSATPLFGWLTINLPEWQDPLQRLFDRFRILHTVAMWNVLVTKLVDRSPDRTRRFKCSVGVDHLHLSFLHHVSRIHVRIVKAKRRREAEEDVGVHALLERTCPDV